MRVLYEKMKMQIKFSKQEVLLLGMILGFMILMCGGNLNSWVIEGNNGKMPFIADYNYIDKEYFSFNMTNKPRFWIFSDVIDIGDYILSIGDVLLYLGATIVIFFLALYEYVKLMEAKNIKRR